MRWVSNLPRDGDQLRLDLFADVPWDGQSPRALTRRFIPLFLRQKPSGSTRFYADPEQLELWPNEGPTPKEKPSELVFARGAPSLLPLPERRF